MGVEEAILARNLGSRRKLSVTDVERMVEAGVIGEKDRVELLDGVLIEMSPKGVKHEVAKSDLNLWFADHRPREVHFAPETTFRLDKHTYLEPDFVFFPTAVGVRGLKGETCLLVVEVSDSSVRYDLGDKPTYYARFGVPECWVVDLRGDRVVVHRDGDGTRYRTITEHGFEETIAPVLIPTMTIRLASILT